MAGLTQNYHETVDPPCAADEGTITLAATNKGLIIPSRYNLGTQFFNKLGRRLHIHASGKMTTSTTPGTLTVALLWGTGADANGTSLVASAAQTLVASQTNIPFFFDFIVQCRTTGTAGSLLAMGQAQFGTALIAAGTFCLPASAPAAVGSLDLTGTSIPSLQALVSSGSGITMTVMDYGINPLN
jgi:hypothetical protein